VVRKPESASGIQPIACSRQKENADYPELVFDIALVTQRDESSTASGARRQQRRDAQTNGMVKFDFRDPTRDFRNCS
jgi:hypothetical protein